MIENLAMRLKAQADVTKGTTAGNLTEQQMQQLVVAGQVLCMPFSIILGNEFAELVSGDEIHDLREYIATDIHNYAVFGL